MESGLNTRVIVSTCSSSSAVLILAEDSPQLCRFVVSDDSDTILRKDSTSLRKLFSSLSILFANKKFEEFQVRYSGFGQSSEPDKILGRRPRKSCFDPVSNFADQGSFQGVATREKMEKQARHGRQIIPYFETECDLVVILIH